jgi:hypothetical protein
MSDDNHVPPHLWCDKQEKLLIRWAEKAAGYRWLHNHARLYYKKYSDMMAYPSIVISSITGVGGFAVLSPHNQSTMSSDARMNIVIVQYIFAFLNVLGCIFTSVNKFSQIQSLTEAHSMMCIQYSKFYRNIDMELSLEKVHRVDVIEFVSKAREEYDRLLDDAPDIPSISIKAFNEKFPNKENKPDVCNGLSVIACETPVKTVGKSKTMWFSAQKRKSMDKTTSLSDLTEVNVIPKLNIQS